jgi:hypothetical protein
VAAMLRHGSRYLTSVWAWLELLTSVLMLTTIGLYITCVVQASSAFSHYASDRTGFTNFDKVTSLHLIMRYIHAWLLFFLMLKVRFSSFYFSGTEIFVFFGNFSQKN